MLMDYLLGFSGHIVYLVIFLFLLACGLGIPIPEDITLIASGVLAYYEVIELPMAIVVCFLGVVIGDVSVFFLGAKYGRKLTKKRVFANLLPPERLDNVKAKLHKYGNRLIFSARFMPGLRAPIYFTAGTLHLPFRIFLFYDAVAALISVPTIISIVYYFGDELDQAVRLVKKVQFGIILLIVLVFLIFLLKWHLAKKKQQESID